VSCAVTGKRAGWWKPWQSPQSEVILLADGAIPAWQSRQTSMRGISTSVAFLECSA
jgi:hypothetical protein